MKNVEEIKTEIFRRSKEKIKKRKTLKSVIISTGLFAFSVVIVLSLNFSMFNIGKSSSDSNMAPEANYGSDYSVLEIKSKNKIINQESGANAEKIYNTIVCFFANEDDSEGSLEGEGFTDITDDSFNSYDKEVEYNFNFKLNNGIEKEYILKDDILTDKLSGISVKLNGKQLNELKLILEEK